MQSTNLGCSAHYNLKKSLQGLPTSPERVEMCAYARRSAGKRRNFQTCLNVSFHFKGTEYYICLALSTKRRNRKRPFQFVERFMVMDGNVFTWNSDNRKCGRHVPLTITLLPSLKTSQYVNWLSFNLHYSEQQSQNFTIHIISSWSHDETFYCSIIIVASQYSCSRTSRNDKLRDL